MTVGPLPWNNIVKDVEQAVRNLYPDKRYVKTHFIAKEICNHPAFYPEFKNASPRAVKVRIMTVFDKHLKWQVFSRNGHGAVFVKPRGWV